MSSDKSLTANGGMDVTRLASAHDLTEAGRLAERNARARGNLAAMTLARHGGNAASAAGEFAELCELLGLAASVQVADRAPGMCRRPGCDRALPMSSAHARGTSSAPYWKAGFCSAACWAETS